MDAGTNSYPRIPGQDGPSRNHWHVICNLPSGKEEEIGTSYQNRADAMVVLDIVMNINNEMFCNIETKQLPATIFYPPSSSRSISQASRQPRHDQPNATLTSNTNILTLPMLSYPGYSVTYLQNPHIQGTIGAHLKFQGGDSTVCGLTCRHVVSSDRSDNESYRLSGQALQHHAQLTVATYRKLLQTFRKHHGHLQNHKKSLLPI